MYEWLPNDWQIFGFQKGKVTEEWNDEVKGHRKGKIWVKCEKKVVKRWEKCLDIEKSSTKTPGRKKPWHIVGRVSK